MSYGMANSILGDAYLCREEIYDIYGIYNVSLFYSPMFRTIGIQYTLLSDIKLFFAVH